MSGIVSRAATNTGLPWFAAIALVAALLALPDGHGQPPPAPSQPPDPHGPLRDSQPAVRLQAALALAREHDAVAVPVLIDLLTEVSPTARERIEEVLRGLAGAWAPPPTAGDDSISRRMRRDAWASWWNRTDGPALLDEFRKRTLTPANMVKLRSLISQLGDPSFKVRERATAELIALGPGIVPLLKANAKTADLEQRHRIDFCINRLAGSRGEALPPAAARLVAMRRPAGAATALLDFLPWTEDPEMADEIGKALGELAAGDPAVPPVLLRALGDGRPARRAAAAAVLCRLGEGRYFPAVRRLINDANPAVRLGAAVALVEAGDRQSVPGLIDIAAELPREQAWHAADLLRRLAGARGPSLKPGADAAARAAYRAAWRSWWNEDSATVIFAQLRAATTRTPMVRATASKSGRNDPPENAFDGDRRTAWNAAGFPPQWIEADLGVSTQLASLVLVVNQDPPCETTHDIWISDEPIGQERATAKLVHTLKSTTRSMQELRLEFPKDTFARYVQIRTTETVGWVAWMEIEMKVGRSRLGFIDDPDKWRSAP
jgi:HEAT repeat protein